MESNDGEHNEGSNGDGSGFQHNRLVEEEEEEEGEDDAIQNKGGALGAMVEDPDDSTDERVGCDVCWCVFIPLAILVSFTIFVTIIAQVGLGIGWYVVVEEGPIIISPYSPEVTATFFSPLTSTENARFVAPVVVSMLTSKTLPLGISSSSNLITSCSRSDSYCPKYYKCSLTNSLCLIDLGPSSPAHPPVNIPLCNKLISSLDGLSDAEGREVSGVNLLSVDFGLFRLLSFCAVSVLAMTACVVLMQDIRQYEDEDEFEVRILSLTHLLKRLFARSIFRSKKVFYLCVVLYAVVHLVLFELIFAAPAMIVFNRPSLSMLQSSVANECFLPSDIQHAIQLADSKDPAKYTLISTLSLLKTVLSYCFATTTIGGLYLLLVFLFTGFKTITSNASRSVELNDYLDSSRTSRNQDDSIDIELDANRSDTTRA